MLAQVTQPGSDGASCRALTSSAHTVVSFLVIKTIILQPVLFIAQEFYFLHWDNFNNAKETNTLLSMFPKHVLTCLQREETQCGNSGCGGSSRIWSRKSIYHARNVKSFNKV